MSLFSDRLVECRKSNKLKQREAAEAIGLTESAYRSYELGRNTPSPETVAKLADYFDVSADYLLGRSVLRKPYSSQTEPQFKSRFYKEEGTAERLTKLREEKHLAQEDIAKELNISAEQYASYERGEAKPTSDQIIELAEFHDASTDYLLGRSDYRHMVPTIAAHTDDPRGIPPEAQEEVLQYIEFIRQKYGIGKKKK